MGGRYGKEESAGNGRSVEEDNEGKDKPQTSCRLLWWQLLAVLF